jgi:hypothetical protein
VVIPWRFRVASDLRATLDAAARARGSLEAVLRGLGRGGRAEDADAVETAIAEAEAAGGHLLEGDVERAREALQRWRGAAASEAKLARALRDGANTAHLARTIQVRDDVALMASGSRPGGAHCAVFKSNIPGF